MKKIAVLFFALLLSLMPLQSVLAEENDSQPPSDVEGLQVEPLDGAVRLTWLPSTDDVGVAGYEIHYGLTPVTESGQVYANIVDVGDVLEHTVTGLENGTTYYFSAIAYDAAGNESLHWATNSPLSATPSADAEEPNGEELLEMEENGDAPQVYDAGALNKEQVLVVFSKEIVLPEDDPQDAFSIENNEDFTELVVLEAEMWEEDETNKTVLLTTEVQEENVEYTLTVHIAIRDLDGNPVISGTSDTAVFMGSGLEMEEVEPLVVLSAESIDSINFGITFNKTVVLGLDPSENFLIHAVDDMSDTLDVMAVTLGENHEGTDDAFAVVRTTPQENKTYLVTVLGVTDEDGNPIDEDMNTATFEGPLVPDEDEDVDDEDVDDPILPDVTPPEDVANFLAQAFLRMDELVVSLTWNLPVDPNWDSVLQRLYMSMDLGDSYVEEAELASDVTSYEIEGLEPGEYWFKLTQEDAAGNESQGVVTKVILTETGPGVVGLLLVSLGLGTLVTRKRKI